MVFSYNVYFSRARPKLTILQLLNGPRKATCKRSLRFREQGSVYEADEKHFDFVYVRNSIDYMVKCSNGHGFSKE